MQFIRAHRRVSAIVAIALAATAMSASAASARLQEGPVQQTEQAVSAIPATPVWVLPPELRSVESQAALGHAYSVASTARNGGAESNAPAKPAPTAAIPAAKIAAPSDHFSWGDAAIGAAVALAIAMLVGGGTLIARRRTQLSEA